MLLRQIGPAGQAKLAAARVLIVGCGALGSVAAGQLVRAGVGFLRIADRDVVEPSNLGRQVLFDQSDADAGVPKSVAAARRLGRINPQVTVEPKVVDVHGGNIEELLDCVDLILDGADNAETRYLVNDAAVKHSIDWIYAACVGVEGRVMPVRCGIGPCLRCVFPSPPAAGELPTCDTVGVLGPAAAIVASLQTTAALQMLIGENPANCLTNVNAWNSTIRSIELGDRRADCPCCAKRQFEFLETSSHQSAAHLCGRNAVQIRQPQGGFATLSELARRLAGVAAVQQSDFLLRCQPRSETGVSLTVFPDGRTIVHGTNDIARARSLVSRYIGS